MRHGLLIGGIALLSAVAVAGWVRKPSPAETVAAFPTNAGPYTTSYQNPAQSYTNSQYTGSQYTAPQPNGSQYPMDSYGQPCATGAYPVRSYAPAPAPYAAPYASTAVYQRPAAYYRHPARRANDSTRSIGYANRYDTYTRPRVVVRRRPRPFSHSLAIVGGGAGAGAAIGALAGGGKGAGIGALAGGAAGLIYDRLTHNR